MPPARAPIHWLARHAYAHRGLHGDGVPENSLAAARAAIAAGHGIECDVRLSRDDVAHVFHDSRLERLTDQSGRFGALSAAHIANLRLRENGRETIPTLAALLALIGARTALLIEIKSGGGPAACARLCRAVALLLANHAGPVAVMSFDPLVPRWFARHCPAVPAGLVASRRYRAGCVARHGIAWATARSRARFVACDVRDLPHAAAWPRRARRPLLSWTVRNPADQARVARHAAQPIFEGLIIEASTP